jgi:hypothetical protein
VISWIFLEWVILLVLLFFMLISIKTRLNSKKYVDYVSVYLIF